MYNFIHFISALIRQFVLPNPYVNIIGNEVYADLFNVFIGGTILHFCAYTFTGYIYIRNIDSSSFGSIGYLISYCCITAIITILGFFISNVTIFIIVFVILYVFLCIMVGLIFNRNKIRY